MPARVIALEYLVPNRAVIPRELQNARRFREQIWLDNRQVRNDEAYGRGYEQQREYPKADAHQRRIVLIQHETWVLDQFRWTYLLSIDPRVAARQPMGKEDHEANGEPYNNNLYCFDESWQARNGMHTPSDDVMHIARNNCNKTNA